MSIQGSCGECIFSRFAKTLSRPPLICKQKHHAVGNLSVCHPLQTCKNFYPSRTDKKIRLIPLTRGQFAIVDHKDYPHLAQFTWFAESAHNTYYAVTKMNKRSVKMHRYITNAPAELVVDHIDHNGLNNTQKNLRLCTFSQNAKNIKSAKPATSKFKGVHFHKRLKKWTAQISNDKKQHHLGYFDNQIDAAKAYNKAAVKYHKQFASLNSIRTI